jgi:hypothetical protein
MDISRQFINNPIRVWLTILLLGIGGIFALLNIGPGRPAFTIKTAVVITHYPAPRRSRLKKKSPCRWKRAATAALSGQRQLNFLQWSVANHRQYRLELSLQRAAANLG